MTKGTLSDIQTLAFFIWERNGRVEGRAMDHWLEAEYLILTSSFVEDENRIEWAANETPVEPFKITPMEKTHHE